MIYNNIELFNIAEYTKEDNIPGIFLHRYPCAVQDKMGYTTSQKGKMAAMTVGGCEIRFMSVAETFEISLYAVGKDTTITVFQGDFQNSTHRLEAGKINKINVQKHPRFITAEADNHNLKRRYNSLLWRIVFDYNATISFVALDTFDNDYYPPSLDDLPNKTFLVYGSSVSQGAGAISILNSYASLFADMTNSDIYNKGLSGSCLLEKEVIDYICICQCDEYILEIGCNARGVMDEVEFSKRFEYLIKCLTTNHPTKKIHVINILEFFSFYYLKFKTLQYNEKNQTFPSIINSIITKYQNGNINLINATELMDSVTCISYDLLHPSNFGHLQMALGLKRIINEN